MARVIHKMIAVIIIYTCGARSRSVRVRYGHSGLSPRYVLMVDIGRFRICESGIYGIVTPEIHKRIVKTALPSVGEIISYLGITVCLAETEIIDGAVCPVIRQRYEGRETAVSHGICNRGKPSVVGAVLRLEGGGHTVFLRIFSYDIYRSCHGIRSVKHGSGSAQHLDAVNIFLIIEIGDMMGIDSGELRLSVNHHKYSTGPVAAHTAEFYVTGSAVADSETENTALGDKQTRDHAGYSGKHLSLSRSLKLPVINDRHRVRQKILRHRAVTSCHDNLIEQSRRIPALRATHLKRRQTHGT